jgi:hypothetical protein
MSGSHSAMTVGPRIIRTRDGVVASGQFEHGEVAIRFWRQIAKESSSNATDSRKVAGSSTASS